MSSSVTRSSVISSPTTITGEKNREANANAMSSPGSIDLVRQIYGTIIEIHDSLPLVRVYETGSGSTVSSNKWIPLIHSPEEIVERFGTIRAGMGVLVTSSGPAGDQSIARIISNEQTKITEEDIIPNTVELGLWEIFTPGVGI